MKKLPSFRGRAEGVLVVVAADAPSVADRVEFIGDAVFVGVGHFREFRALDDVDGLVVDNREPERFVQAAGEPGELRVRRCLGLRIFDEPDFPAAGAGEQLAVGPEGEAADFEHAIGRRERGDAVELRFARRRWRCRSDAFLGEVFGELLLHIIGQSVGQFR